MYFQAFIVFVIAAVSDALDGFLARFLDQRTELGARLDPVADKILLTASFVTLAVMEIIPNWLAVIIIVRDILIVLGFSCFYLIRNKCNIKPSFVSKCTTTVQSLTVFLVLYYPDVAQMKDVKNIFFALTSGLTVFTGMHYLYTGIQFVRNAAEIKG